MKTRLWVFAVAAAVVVAVVVLGFLEGRKERATEAEREKAINVPSRVSQVGGLTAIHLDVASQRASGIAVKAPGAAVHHSEVQAIATVLSVQDLSGLRSTWVAARSRVDAANAAARASEAEHKRLLVLHDEAHSISDQMLQAAEAAWRTDGAALQSAQAALAATRQNANQQWGPALARAAVENTPLYLRLVNQQEVLLQVVLPASASMAAPPPQARVQVRQNTFVSARLISAAPRTDARQQGASFFYSAPSAGLLPGISLTVFLPVGTALQGSMIPASAIVWWQGGAWVYTQNRADRFVRRALPANQSMEGGGWFVSHDFGAGEPVVIAGAQLLFSEELRSQITVGEDGGE